MALNKSRVVLGGLVGGVVWNAWSILIYAVKMGSLYAAGQNAGLFLKQSRYPFFMGQWILLLFILAILAAYFYAWSRSTMGPGWMSAFRVGATLGFFAGFPSALAQANWSPLPRELALGQMLEMWVGAILATIVAGYLYKE